MNLATIPAQAAFLDELAAAWLARQAAPAAGMILLPTRRAARALAESFLRAGAGRPMLLPRIVALGALDETPLALAGALDLPPAIAPAARHAGLARMILALPEAAGGAGRLDAAWMLARELAALMDEAERAEVDLRAALAAATPEAYAAHWQVTLRFLAIVTDAWPAHLAAQGLSNPAARQAALLRAQARAWRDCPPAEPVWAAGLTGAGPAASELLRTLAGTAQGLVILPGLDTALDEAAWQALGASHPQAGMARLLAELGALRGDVALWPAAATARPTLFSRALLPAESLAAWRDGGPPAEALAGLARLSAADEQQEAVAIAMILRDALQTPGARAALITPDRVLAGRVAAELRRWGVIADDSAGEKLADTPPATFLRLLAATLVDDLGPVSLLALLKHPLAAAGLDPAACRAGARALELAALRGPRPAGGMAGLRAGVAKAEAGLRDFVERLLHCLAPALRTMASIAEAPEALLAGLIAAAENLAASDAAAGPARLWALEEGEALAGCLAEALPALDGLPDQSPGVLPGLLDAVLEGAVVRSRRALRAGDAAEHPRVFIWGLLEARLQAVDVAVLGGLVEGVWPRAGEAGPWMSRPMRLAAGLDDPEAAIGQAAHDMLAAACAAGVAVLSCPLRREGAPAVPARWLVRLEACLAGSGMALPAHPAAAWAAALDQPDGPARPATAPRPCPPPHLRPRRLSVTEIETWITDPYAIHARHILRLVPLDPLEQGTDAADYGTLVHQALAKFFAADWPDDPAAALREIMDAQIGLAGLHPALRAWWRPRLHRIADWVAGEEARRRAAGRPVLLRSEVKGEWALPGVEVGFVLTGRADRIERRADGGIGLIDYKTGTLPSAKAVTQLRAPQLPLEAAMALGGGFGPEFTGAPAELTYWQLSGGFEPGEVLALFKGDPAATLAAAQTAEVRLRGLVQGYDDPQTAYLAQPHPGLTPRFAAYAQLARVAEWSLDDGAADAAEGGA